VGVAVAEGDVVEIQPLSDSAMTAIKNNAVTLRIYTTSFKIMATATF